MMRVLLGLILCVLSASQIWANVRIKDVAKVQGVRENQLIGYGLVVGLAGTGDDTSSVFAVRSVVSMLEQMGVTLSLTDADFENVAAVMVTATLPAFVKPGSRIDVLVSSIGTSESLQGGNLMMTPLMGANRQIYAVAQGPLSIGAGAPGEAKHLTVARVPDGALVEREVPMNVVHEGKVRFALNQPDFTTVMRMAKRINHVYEDAAQTLDGATVEVTVPEEYLEGGRHVQFVASLESLPLQTDAVSHVVINERTGTIVAGEKIRINTVAVAHGNLSVTIKRPEKDPEYPEKTKYRTKEEKVMLLEQGVSIGEVAMALNSLGVGPSDMISILQAIKLSGALQAEVRVV